VLHLIDILYSIQDLGIDISIVTDRARNLKTPAKTQDPWNATVVALAERNGILMPARFVLGLVTYPRMASSSTVAALPLNILILELL
jgi:hypothetical protein